MTYRRLRITTPDLGVFYSVVDEQYEPRELASTWLRTRIYAAGHSESTSAEYASSLATYLTWVGRADLATAASKMHLFAAYLAVAPIESGARRGYPRSAGRINRILVAVREFYRFAVAEDALTRMCCATSTKWARISTDLACVTGAGNLAVTTSLQIRRQPTR